MKLSEMAEIIEDDKRHENTVLALKMQDGMKRLRRIMNFNKFVEKLSQVQQPGPAPAPIAPLRKPQPKKPVEQTAEEPVDDDFGLPPEPEADLFGEEFTEEKE